MGSVEVRALSEFDDLRAVDGLVGPHYASAFELSVPGAEERSPEQWLRAVFEGAPRPVRWLVRVGWRVGLGVRLGPFSVPERVFGCPLVRSDDEAAIFEMESKLIAAHNVVLVRDGRVRCATFVRYERPSARALWSVAAVIHIRLAPYLLRRAGTHPPEPRVR